MGKYRRIPTETEAIQFDGKNWGEMVMFTGTRTVDGHTMPLFNHAGTYLLRSFLGQTEKQVAELWVAANDAHVFIEIGEWVLKDEKGFYPCKDDMFKKFYESVEAR